MLDKLYAWHTFLKIVLLGPLTANAQLTIENLSGQDFNMCVFKLKERVSGLIKTTKVEIFPTGTSAILDDSLLPNKDSFDSLDMECYDSEFIKHHILLLSGEDFFQSLGTSWEPFRYFISKIEIVGGAECNEEVKDYEIISNRSYSLQYKGYNSATKIWFITQKPRPFPAVE